MDARSMKMIVAVVRLVTATAAVCIGLGAMGVNVEEVLRIASISNVVRCGVGLCGAYSLLAWFRSCCSDCGSCKK